jgi:hypothetical protein
MSRKRRGGPALPGGSPHAAASPGSGAHRAPASRLLSSGRAKRPRRGATGGSHALVVPSGTRGGLVFLGSPPHLVRAGEEGEVGHDRPVGTEQNEEAGFADEVDPIPRWEPYVAVASDGAYLLCVRSKCRLW